VTANKEALVVIVDHPNQTCKTKIKSVMISNKRVPLILLGAGEVVSLRETLQDTKMSCIDKRVDELSLHVDAKEIRNDRAKVLNIFPLSMQ